MARHRVRYVTDKSGNVLRHPCTILRFRGEERPTELRERVLKAYYSEECAKGARFKSGYSKTAIKRAWEAA